MPFLQEKVGTFHNFASSALNELYSDSRLDEALKLEVNTLESGILSNDGKGGFSWQALPRFAQISPAFGVVLVDLDGDGDLDAALAQNSFSPQRETGRMDGGLSLVMTNDGNGQFTLLSAAESGVVIPSDAQSLSFTDLNLDGLPDLVFGINDGPIVTYLNQSKEKSLTVSLESNAIGAKVTINGVVRELVSGGSYLAQSSGLLTFPRPDQESRALVQWPDRSTSEHVISPDASEVEIRRPLF